MKKFFKDILSKIKDILRKSAAETEEERIARQIKNGMPPYSRCMNCGTGLEGMYCHKCGQYASEKNASMKDFIAEYLHVTFHVDSQIIPSICHLVTRPGHLTQTFIDGKVKSYVHPLKLNIFLLFIVIAVMVLFSAAEKSEKKLMSLMTNTKVITELAINEVMADEEYVERMYSSDKDTVHFICMNTLAEKHKEHITVLEVMSGSEESVSDTLLAVIPSVLIEDGILTEKEDGIFEISTDRESFTALEEINYLNRIWGAMLGLLSKYLPIIILLTCPLMAWVIWCFYRRMPNPFMHYFVFTLHYTAFLEIFLFILFLISSIIHIPRGLLIGIFMTVPAVYLTMALKKIFHDRNWGISVMKMVMINLIYSVIVFFIIVLIMIISIIMTI